MKRLAGTPVARAPPNLYLGDSAPDRLAEYFDFEIEGNIPTLYSVVAVLICSGLLAPGAHRFVVRDAIRRPGKLPAGGKRTGSLSLIEHDILPRVILEDQNLRDCQQQGGKQGN